jgi:hypothetical protein
MSNPDFPPNSEASKNRDYPEIGELKDKDVTRVVSGEVVRKKSL